MLKLATTVATGKVKWFDPSRGYGFAVLDGIDGDCLIHSNALREGGFEQAKEGAIVEVEMTRRPNGWQAIAVLDMDESNAVEPKPNAPGQPHIKAEPESAWVRVVCKWFSRDRGFGFVSRCDGSADIFVHMLTAKACGIGSLRPKKEYEVRYGHGSSGLVVADIRLPSHD